MVKVLTTSCAAAPTPKTTITTLVTTASAIMVRIAIMVRTVNTIVVTSTNYTANTTNLKIIKSSTVEWPYTVIEMPSAAHCTSASLLLARFLCWTGPRPPPPSSSPCRAIFRCMPLSLGWPAPPEACCSWLSWPASQCLFSSFRFGR